MRDYPMPICLLLIFISSSVCCSFCAHCACCFCCCQRHYYHYDHYQQQLQHDEQRRSSSGSSIMMLSALWRKLQQAKRSVHVASRLVWFSLALCFRVLITIIKQRSGFSRLLWCLLPAARPGQRNNNERSAATEP